MDDPAKEHLLRGLTTVSIELSVTRDKLSSVEAILAPLVETLAKSG